MTESIKEKNSEKKYKILSVALFVVIVIECSFFVYNKKSDTDVSKKLYSVYYETSDGVYEEASTNSFDLENYSLNISRSTCENGGTVSQTSSGVTFTGSVDKCTLYFDQPVTLINHIYSLAGDADDTSTEIIGDTGLAYDGTTDKNLRYVGPTPNNYVSFNGELWRIIGVFNNISDGTNTETMVKLIRSDSIGNMVWNSGGWTPANNWEASVLCTLLNSGDYYKATGSYVTTGMKAASKDYIKSVVWHLGSSSDTQTPDVSYTIERGTTVYSGRSATWTGTIGLFYTSDYGFATSGGSSKDRSTCLATKMTSWANTDCANNDWLFLKANEWTITHSTYSASWVKYITSTGNGGGAGAGSSYAARPTVFLKPDVKYVTGTGTSSDPFIIKLN